MGSGLPRLVQSVQATEQHHRLLGRARPRMSAWLRLCRAGMRDRLAHVSVSAAVSQMSLPTPHLQGPRRPWYLTAHTPG